MENNNIYEEKAEKLLLTEIINFVKSDSGKYLVSLVNSTKQNRVNDLVYSDNKDETLQYQGEVRAYNDVLSLFEEKTLISIREQVGNTN